jgi:hypothetical protein
MDIINVAKLLQTYKTITKIMEYEGLTMDNSFRRVQSWLSNKICDQLKDDDIISDEQVVKIVKQ